jgi:hypothetical protein
LHNCISSKLLFGRFGGGSSPPPIVVIVTIIVACAADALGNLSTGKSGSE